jgi:hypothetical protein
LKEWPWICGPGLPPASSIMVGAMSMARTIGLITLPGLDQLRVAHEERGADALLVGEAALGAQAVLAEEEAVVAEEHDAGVVEGLFFSIDCSSIPTPSSTEAIIAARSRTSSGSPTWIGSRKPRMPGGCAARTRRCHAGLSLSTSSSGMTLGRGGYLQPR